MSKGKRARYTLEFKIEAVRLVRGGQSVGAGPLFETPIVLPLPETLNYFP